ncbi:multidrug effflux MFS transporter [Comamonas sp. CMM03]|uniref:multidrug effflux MFS transporter n=1 Tax=Comamonas sp. CMM03 TaxID=2854781 RepID=UPI001C44DDE1|nr:multidrug effflux MFS transporter [Comamonas sp. CMM03]MBV7419995.1 multidrug effflux MFS transporter [Comamonas sp. CMM03]
MSPLLVIGLLALLLGLQPITTDLYLPTLPLLTAQLQAPVAQTQLTLTALLLAFGGSQLVWGPVSDRWGRRPVLLAGLALYVVAALGCALAPSMDWLVAWRTLQGVATGAGVMAARAIVRDLYTPTAGAQAMSKALTGLGVIACASPIAGSQLAQHFGWRATMAALAVFGAATLVLVALCFRESLATPRPDATQPRQLARTWAAIVRHPTFLAYTATTSGSYAGLFTFLAASSFTFIGVLGWTAADVGLLLGVNGACYIAGTILCRRLLQRLGVRRTVALAGLLAVLGNGSLLAAALLEVTNAWAYALPFSLYMVAHGIQQPCGQSGAVSAFPQAAGTAAALNGCAMTLTAFAMGAWLGQHLDGTVYPLVFGTAFWAAWTALASWVLVRRWGVAPAA